MFWICQVISAYVTLCRWPAKQTIPLSVLARNQTKGFGLEFSACPEVVTGREKRVGWEKELKAVGDGTRTDAVDSGHSSREDRVQRRRSSQDVGIPFALWNFR